MGPIRTRLRFQNFATQSIHFVNRAEMASIEYRSRNAHDRVTPIIPLDLLSFLKS